MTILFVYITVLSVLFTDHKLQFSQKGWPPTCLRVCVRACVRVCVCAGEYAKRDICTPPESLRKQVSLHLITGGSGSGMLSFRQVSSTLACCFAMHSVQLV